MQPARRLLSQLVLLSCVCCGSPLLHSQPAPASNEATLKALAQELDPDTTHWIAAGDQQLLAILEPALAQQSRGTVLLLHGASEHPDWPGHLRDIRRYLPDVGWSTLSLALPSTTDTDAQTRNIAPDAGETNSAATTATPDGAIQTAAIRAAIDWLAQRGESRVVLYGQGSGAQHATAYLCQAGNRARGLILLDAPAFGASDGFACLTNARLPVLDLFSSRSPVERQAAAERLATARRQGLATYQQLDRGSAGPATRRIHGFLKRHFE